jgi:hypothetical protein
MKACFFVQPSPLKQSCGGVSRFATMRTPASVTFLLKGLHPPCLRATSAIYRWLRKTGATASDATCKLPKRMDFGSVALADKKVWVPRRWRWGEYLNRNHDRTWSIFLCRHKGSAGPLLELPVRLPRVVASCGARPLHRLVVLAMLATPGVEVCRQTIRGSRVAGS